MAEITQRLGFEAGQAIATLHELSTAIGQVNSQLRVLNTLTGQTRGLKGAADAFANARDKALEADRRIRTLRQTFQDVGEKGSKAGRDITVSWQTLVRVVQTQLIVRALSTLQQAFLESAEAAREFEITVARISNIAQGPGSAIEELKNSVRELSNELGRPLDEVGTAAFEAFQNDLGNTTETIEILRGAAGDLALVTGGQLVDGVNAISSVMKVFSLDASEANNIADVLFGTIDKGRVTLNELANSLGSVAPLGREVSASYREIAAAIAAITLQGVDASRAQTQLRGVFNALLKPTKELQAAFETLGVSSGRELIETSGGLIQALQALESEAAGNEVAFRAFFGRIRGQLGAINILNDNASEATRILAELREETGRAAEGAEAINETDARQAVIAFQELSNVMTELGEVANNVQRVLAQGLLAVIPSAEALTLVISGVAAAIGVAAASALLLGTALTAALAPIAILAIATLAALKLTGVMSDLISETFSYNEELEKQKEALEEIDKIAKKTTKEQVEEVKRSTKALKESIKDFTDEATENWEDYGEAVKDVNEAITTATESALENFKSKIEGILDAIDDRINGIDDAFTEASEAAADAAGRLEEFKFESSIRGQDELEQATARTSRAQKAFNSALRDARNIDIRDPKALEGIREELEGAEELARQADRAAQGTDDERLQRRAQGLVKRNLELQAALERRNAQQLFDFREGLNRTEFELQKNRLEDLVELAKEVGAAQTAEGIAEQFGTEKQKEAAEKAAEEAREAFADEVKKIDFNLLDQLGLGNLARQAIATVAKELDQADIEWTNAASALQEALNEAGPFKAQVEVSQLLGAPTGQEALDEALLGARAAGGTGDPGAAIQGQIDILGEFIAQQTKAGRESEAFRDRVNTSLQGMNQAVESQLTNPLRRAFDFIKRGFTADPFGEVDTSAKAGRATFQGLADDLRAVGEALVSEGQIPATALELKLAEIAARGDKARQDGIITSEQEQALALGLIPILEAVQAAKDENARRKLIDPEVTADAQQRLDDLKERTDALEFSPDFRDLRDGLEETKTQTQASETNLSQSATNASTLATNMGTTAENTKTAAEGSGQTQSNTQASIQPTAALAVAWANVAKNAQAAAVAAAAAGGAGGAATAYFGGKPVYKQKGGPTTRGQDTQLVAASPGEIFLNQRVSRNISSELLALNANQTPQFREQGGPVTNIGDVNVNVTTDSSGGIDGRQIGQDIRRELRRGTLRLS